MSEQDSSKDGKWIVVCESDLLVEGAIHLFHVAERPVAVCRICGKVKAFSAVCPHRGALLPQGKVSGSVLTCPWHGWQFDLQTGAGITNPHSMLLSYDAEERDGRVFVRTS